MAWYRIVARNAERTEAYAERISSYKRLNFEGDIYVVGISGNHYFGKLDDLIEDPEIIKRCSADWLYKIKLPDQKGDQ